MGGLFSTSSRKLLTAFREGEKNSLSRKTRWLEKRSKLENDKSYQKKFKTKICLNKLLFVFQKQVKTRRHGKTRTEQKVKQLFEKNRQFFNKTNLFVITVSCRQSF